MTEQPANPKEVQRTIARIRTTKSSNRARKVCGRSVMATSCPIILTTATPSNGTRGERDGFASSRIMQMTDSPSTPSTDTPEPIQPCTEPPSPEGKVMMLTEEGAFEMFDRIFARYDSAFRKLAESDTKPRTDTPELEMTPEQVEAGLGEVHRIITQSAGYYFGGELFPFDPRFKSLALRAVASLRAEVKRLTKNALTPEEAEIVEVLHDETCRAEMIAHDVECNCGAQYIREKLSRISGYTSGGENVSARRK